MLVFVLYSPDKGLMPCKPQRSCIVLKNGKKVVPQSTPFTTRLKYGTSSFKQELSTRIGFHNLAKGAAVVTGNFKMLYHAETTLRTEVFIRKMETRKTYRLIRRERKKGYRKPRSLNRKALTKLIRLPPSRKGKGESHLQEKKHIESNPPTTICRQESMSFDIHDLNNTDVPNAVWPAYQRSNLYGFQNLKQCILKKNANTCQIYDKDSQQRIKLHVQQTNYRSNNETDTKNNLITLRKPSHDKIHKKKHTQQNSLKQSILTRLVPKGDYKHTKGSSPKKSIPTGKLYGLRKTNLIRTFKGISFIEGKRSE